MLPRQRKCRLRVDVTINLAVTSSLAKEPERDDVCAYNARDVAMRGSAPRCPVTSERKTSGMTSMRKSRDVTTHGKHRAR
ncbi:unnamed protein product [Lampetra planeri]